MASRRPALATEGEAVQLGILHRRRRLLIPRCGKLAAVSETALRVGLAGLQELWMPAEDFVAVWFADALAVAAAGDEDRRWELVSRLHVDGGRQALVTASALCNEADPTRRALGAEQAPVG